MYLEGRKKMKKVLGMMLLIAMCCSLIVGCGNSNEKPNSAGKPNSGNEGGKEEITQGIINLNDYIFILSFEII
mgnify:CR=1 FL=1